MVYVFLADGFEEIEALCPVDVLRRGGIEVQTVGVTGKTVMGAHGIPVVADIEKNETTFYNIEAVVLPGGMPGTLNLEKDSVVQKFIDFCDRNRKVLGAICAAPSVLGHKGLLSGKKAVCYPGFEKDLDGATVLNIPCVKDDNIITACGAGAAFDFGFMLLEELTKDREKTEELKRTMRYFG